MNSLDALREIQERMSRLKRQSSPSKGSDQSRLQREQLATALTEIQSALPSVIRDLRQGADINEIRATLDEFASAANEINKCVRVLR